MSAELRIGRLNGGYVVTWWEGDKRRRYRLDAQSRAAAETEALTVFQRETLKSEGITVGSLWEMYRQEKEGRRVAVAMGFEWRAMHEHFAAVRPEDFSIDICRRYIAARRKAGKHDGTIWTELGR